MKYLLIIFAFIILRSNAFAQNNDPDQSGCPYEETVELTYYSGSIKYFGELGEVLYEESYTMMEDDFCEGWYSSDYWECYSYPVTVLETQTFWRECPPEPLSPQTAYATVRDEDLESDYPLTINNYQNKPNYTDYYIPNDMYSDLYWYSFINFYYDCAGNTDYTADMYDMSDYNLTEGQNDNYNPYIYTSSSGTIVVSSTPLTQQEVSEAGNDPCDTYSQINIQKLNDIYNKPNWADALNKIDGKKNYANEHSISLTRFVVEGTVVGYGNSKLIEGSPDHVNIKLINGFQSSSGISNSIYIQTTAVIHTHPVRDVTLVNGQPRSAWDSKPVYTTAVTKLEQTFAPPSAGDLYAFLELAQKANSWSLTPAFIVKASNGDDYALMMNNQQLANNFLNNYPKDLDDKGNFTKDSSLDKMFKEYYNRYRSNDRHEKQAYALASLLKEVCPGVSLYKKGSGASSWSQLNTEETIDSYLRGLINIKKYTSNDCN